MQLSCREQLRRRDQHRRSGGSARRLPPRPAGSPDSRPGDARARDVALGRRRRRRALHPERLDGGTSGAGLPLLPRRQGALGPIPPCGGKDARWGDRTSVSPEAMAVFLCTIFDEWVRYDIERLGVQNFLECLLVVEGRSGQSLCHVEDLWACARHGARRKCLRLRPLRRPGSPPRRPSGSDALASLVDLAEQVDFGSAKFRDLPRCCRECPVSGSATGAVRRTASLPPVTASRDSTTSARDTGVSTAMSGPISSEWPSIRATGVRYRPSVTSSALAEHEERARWRATGRNEACPCASGRKFKNCCWFTRRR